MSELLQVAATLTRAAFEVPGDVAGATAEEIALSIVAEIKAALPAVERSTPAS